MRSSLNFLVSLTLGLCLTVSPMLQSAPAAPQEGDRHGDSHRDDRDEWDRDQPDLHRDDHCERLPDLHRRADGIDKHCPALGSSSGIAKGDFNGDGFADLATGLPGATVRGAVGAGDVIVTYGSQNGLTTTGAQLWYAGPDRSLPGGGPAAGDSFGAALASGDFNGDGFSDLAIGIPNRAVADPLFPLLTHNGEGAVIVLYGSSTGLTSTDPGKPAPQFISFGSVQIPAAFCGVFGGCRYNLDNAHFGRSLGWGNFNGDTTNGIAVGDLSIGIPGTQKDLGTKSGAVFVILGKAAAGLTLESSRILSFDETNFSGTDSGNDGESFGAALSEGDYNGDGFSDLVIGAPGRNVGGVTGAGVVFVVSGNADMQTATQKAHSLHPLASQPFLGRVPNTNLAFGGVLASGDFDGDTKSDLAIGVPNFDIGPDANAGAVVVLFGAPGGLSTTGQVQQWFPANFHPGLNEANAGFASALAAGDFNDDGATDLAIGVPFKDIVVIRSGQVVALQDAGEVDVMYGSSQFLLQPTNGPGAQVWTQENVLGAGHASAGSRFGASLTAWNFGHNEFIPVRNVFLAQPTADLAIGVPFQTVNGIVGAGAVNVIYGSTLSNFGSSVGTGLSLTFPVSALSADSIGFSGTTGAHFGAALY